MSTPEAWVPTPSPDDEPAKEPLPATRVASDLTQRYDGFGESANESTDGEQLTPGSRWGPFEIERLLGRGGMGAVYLARETALDRRVALKVLLSGTLAGPEQLARFRVEAAATADLEHPGVVRLYQAGEHEGLPYLAMEYVEGDPLDALIRKRKPKLERALRWVGQTARALEAAHDRGVIHRDIKPSNILIERATGAAKLMDFGIARREASGQLTATGAVVGTPSYMSPEQANGRPAAATSDVFSLGAVLYQLLTGQLPRQGGNLVELLRMASEQELPSPRQHAPRLPRDVETICLKATALNPRRRYRSAAALADDIEAYLERRPIAARRASLAYLAERWVRRRPLLAGLIALALVVGLPAVVWWSQRPGTLELELELPADIAADVAIEASFEGRPLAFEGLTARVDGPPGARQLQLDVPGCEPIDQLVSLTRGQVSRQTVRLRRATGEFDLTASPTGSTITIGGVGYGARVRGRFPTGEHQILVRHENSYDARLRWTARSDAPTSGHVNLGRAVWAEIDRLDEIRMIRFGGDFNDDGLPDLLVHDGNRVAVYDVWAPQATRLRRHDLSVRADQAITLADLDGDGREELIVLGFDVLDGNQSRPHFRIHALYPEPKVLAELRPPDGVARWWLPRCRPRIEDVDGDGRPEILVTGVWDRHVTCYGADGSIRWTTRLAGTSHRSVIAQDDSGRPQLIVASTAGLAALELGSGTVRWQLAITQDQSEVRGSAKAALTHEHRFEHPWLQTAEFDGRPGQDLLVPVITSDNPARREAIDLVAVSAAGQHLWRAPAGGYASDGGAHAPGAHAIADLDGDGRDDVVALIDGRPDVRPERRKREIRWALIDGADGRRRWTATHRKLLVLRAPRPQLVAIDANQLCRLSPANGQPEQRSPLGFVASGFAAVDGDAGGREELIVCGDQGTVAVFDGELRLTRSLLMDVRPRDIKPCGDVNGDGVRDLLVSCDGVRLVLGRSQRWQVRLPNGIPMRPLVTDLDGDGEPELTQLVQEQPLRSQLLQFSLDGRLLARGHAYGTPIVIPKALSASGRESLIYAWYDGLFRQRSAAERSQLWVPCPPVLTRPRLIPAAGRSPARLAVGGTDVAGRFFLFDLPLRRGAKPALEGKLLGGSYQSPAPIQADSDPELELVVQSVTQIGVVDDDGRELWSLPVKGRFNPLEPAIADADGDGAQEVALQIGRTVAVLGDSRRPRWIKQLNVGATQGPVLLDGSNPPALLISLMDGVCCLRMRDGEQLWRYSTGRRGVRAVLVEDLDGDGANEIIVSAHDQTIRVLDGRGQLRWFWPDGASVRMVAVDTDGDGRPELITAVGRWLTCYGLTPRTNAK